MPSFDALMDTLSGRPERDSFSGTLASTVPGVRFTERTAAERYEVGPDYQRFDQKLNMTRRFLWQPEVIELRRERLENRERLVRSGKPGYGLLDWGFSNAAEANQRVSHFESNAPNRGPSSWKPLGPRPPADMRWNGDPAANSRAVKKIARLFGAGDVGMTMLDRRWVYARWFDEETRESYPVRFSDEPGYEGVTEPVQLEDRTQVVPASMKYVAVFVLPMDRRGIAAAPGLAEWGAAHTTYSAISRLIVSVAEFIRGLGYNAIPTSNCTALSIPLAIDAGLGELGRNAKLIHPVWGPVCRVCKVITDLPLEPDVPIQTGATAFCESCGKCAEACPSRAIPKGPRSADPAGDYSSGAVAQWQMDHWKCFEYWARVGTNCGLCLRACPFNKGSHWTHQVVKTAIARVPALNPLIARMDDFLGYGGAPRRGYWE